MSGLGSTPATVGPGSYGTYFNQEVGHAYAPFSSTSDRDQGSAVRPAQFTTPGPGSYDITGRRYQGGPRFLTAPSDVGFLSKSERGQQGMTELGSKPGPGAYEAKSDFARKHVPPTASSQSPPRTVGREDRHVVWFRAPSAPSIPRQDQAFGYEEGPMGQLVKQKAPIETYKGDTFDKVGPGNYDPSIAVTRPNVRGSDFSRSKSARTSITRAVPQGAMLELNPGPGSYQLAAPPVPDVAMNVKKPTATFASRVLRPHQLPDRSDNEAKKPVPGPGAYKVPDSFQKAKQAVPEMLQCFGSTSKRSVDMGGAKRVPGPGAYEEVRSSFEPDMGAVRMARRVAPFMTTGGRFDQAAARESLPGPGAYDQSNRDNFVAHLVKKRFSRGGNFGSTSKRFMPQDAPPLEQPPAASAYDTHSKPARTQGQLKKGPMSVFLSATGRFNKPQPQDLGPAPGQYYKSVEWSTGYKRPDNSKSVFISNDTRFKQFAVKDTVPGPGQYSQELMTVGGEVQKVLRRRALTGDIAAPSQFGGEQRFQSTEKGHQAPGPGAYTPVDPYSQLIKRSFNITVEGSI